MYLDPDVLIQQQTGKGMVTLNPALLQQIMRKIEDSQEWVNRRNHGLPHTTLKSLLALLLSRPDDDNKDHLFGTLEWLTEHWLVPYVNADGRTMYWIPKDEGWRPFDDRFEKVKGEVLAELTKDDQSLSHLVKNTSGSKDYLRRVLAQLKHEEKIGLTKQRGRYGTYQTYSLVEQS